MALSVAEISELIIDTYANTNSYHYFKLIKKKLETVDENNVFETEYGLISVLWRHRNKFCTVWAPSFQTAQYIKNTAAYVKWKETGRITVHNPEYNAFYSELLDDQLAETSEYFRIFVAEQEGIIPPFRDDFDGDDEDDEFDSNSDSDSEWEEDDLKDSDWQEWVQDGCNKNNNNNNKNNKNSNSNNKCRLKTISKLQTDESKLDLMEQDDQDSDWQEWLQDGCNKNNNNNNKNNKNSSNNNKHRLKTISKLQTDESKLDLMEEDDEDEIYNLVTKQQPHQQTSMCLRLYIKQFIINKYK